MAYSRENNYEFVKMVGCGGMASVELWRRKAGEVLGEGLVVAKRIYLGQSGDEESNAKKEAQVLRQLVHPHIVKYLGSWVNKETKDLIIVQEYCQGGDLSSAIRKGKKAGLVFPASDVIRWFSQIAHALQYCHTTLQVLHRDLKPSNIFLSGDRSKAFLGDFGVAKALDSTKALLNTFIGTELYMSPEVLRMQSYGLKSDVWGLGTIFYELCALEKLFDAKGGPLELVKTMMVWETPPPLPEAHGYPEEFEKLCRAMLTKEVDRRPTLTQLLAGNNLLREAVLSLERELAWPESLVPPPGPPVPGEGGQEAEPPQYNSEGPSDGEAGRSEGYPSDGDGYPSDGYPSEGEADHSFQDLPQPSGSPDASISHSEHGAEGAEADTGSRSPLAPSSGRAAEPVRGIRRRSSQLKSSRLFGGNRLSPLSAHFASPTAEGRDSARSQSSLSAFAAGAKRRLKVGTRGLRTPLVAEEPPGDDTGWGRPQPMPERSKLAEMPPWLRFGTATGTATASGDHAGSAQQAVPSPPAAAEAVKEAVRVQDLLELTVRKQELEDVVARIMEPPEEDTTARIMEPMEEEYPQSPNAPQVLRPEGAPPLPGVVIRPSPQESPERDPALQRDAARIDARLRCVETLQTKEPDPVELTVTLRHVKEMALDSEDCGKAVLAHAHRLSMRAEDTVSSENSPLPDVEQAVELLEAVHNDVGTSKKILENAGRRLLNAHELRRQVGLRCICGPHCRIVSVWRNAPLTDVRAQVAEKWNRSVESLEISWTQGPLDTEEQWQHCLNAHVRGPIVLHLNIEPSASVPKRRSAKRVTLAKLASSGPVDMGQFVQRSNARSQTMRDFVLRGAVP